MYLESINPVDYKPIKKYREYGQEKVKSIIDQTQNAFLTWKKHPHSHRVECLKKASDILLSRKEEFAQLITLEMGKPIVQAREEIEKCAWGCRYYADNTKLFLVDEPIVTEASNSFVSYEPLGIIPVSYTHLRAHETR